MGITSGLWLSSALPAGPWRCRRLPGEQVGGGVHVLCGPVLTPLVQVAQTARALRWIVKTLRDGGLGSGEDPPTLGEWVACSFESGSIGSRQGSHWGLLLGLEDGRHASAKCSWACPSPNLTQSLLPMGGLAQGPALLLCIVLERGQLQEMPETQSQGLGDRQQSLCS